MTRLHSALTLASLLLSSAACAQQLRQDRRELRQDRQELRQDQRETRDDRRDRAEAATLLARYDAALRRHDVGALAALDAEALRAMDRELSESRVESARDAAETGRDGREVALSRFERNTTPGRIARADDRRDLRDDRRDRRDDVRDARAERWDRARVQAVRADYAALSGRMDGGSLQRKRALLEGFLAHANRELGADAAERREDRREQREDRRERREDGR